MSADYTSLDHRVIDAAIAERVCGWRWMNVNSPRPAIFMPPEQWGQYIPAAQESVRVRFDIADTPNPPDRLPRYSTDYNAVREALGKLAHGEPHEAAAKIFGSVIYRILNLYYEDKSYDMVLSVLRLTPRQICEAILEALDKEAVR